MKLISKLGHGARFGACLSLSRSALASAQAQDAATTSRSRCRSRSTSPLPTCGPRSAADYCGISSWIAPGVKVPCEITSGKGEVGTVRTIAGRVIEIDDRQVASSATATPSRTSKGNGTTSTTASWK